MSLHIINDTIEESDCDAIVNSTNPAMVCRTPGSGAEGMIHQAAGPGLAEECKTREQCEPGKAIITMAYDLYSLYVIHTVGPVWQGGAAGEKEQLESCYRSCLELARTHDCRSIAFPLISAGENAYPKDDAVEIAVKTIRKDLVENGDLEVDLVFPDEADCSCYAGLY